MSEIITSYFLAVSVFIEKQFPQKTRPKPEPNKNQSGIELESSWNQAETKT